MKFCWLDSLRDLLPPSRKALFHRINLLERNLIMKNDQLAQALTAAAAAVGDIGAQLTKAMGEITADIQSLKDQIGGTTPEVDAAFSSLMGKINSAQAVAQSLDDIVKDVPETPPADGGDVPEVPPGDGGGTPETPTAP